MKEKLVSQSRFLFTTMVTVLMVVAFVYGGKNTISISGVVEAGELDADDNIKSVAIGVMIEEGKNEGEFEYYYIANTGKGKELLELVGESVIITGTVRKDGNGNNLLTVNKYTIIKEELMPDEDSMENFEIEEL